MKSIIKSLGLICLLFLLFLGTGCDNTHYKRALAKLSITDSYTGKTKPLGIREVLIIEEHGDMAKVRWSEHWQNTFWVNTSKDFLRLD